LSSDSFRVQVCDQRRDRRRGLLESRGNLQLLLVHLLGLLPLLMLENRFQIFLRAVEESDTDVGLLERSDIVRSISGHEGNVAERLECSEDELLLRGRNASVDPRVLYEVFPSW
jgi:hypothetical protein